MRRKREAIKIKDKYNIKLKGKCNKVNIICTSWGF